MLNTSAAHAQHCDDALSEFRGDVIAGLGSRRKRLDPKYFYDKTGSALFEHITRLPEYYITRTETRLMEQLDAEIGRDCADVQAVVEFGSGSGRRSELLLGALPAANSYVPMDVSSELLEATRDVIRRAYPLIRVIPVIADFGEELVLPAEVPSRRLGYFPGSTIGNFNPQDATRFLARARTLLGGSAHMLVGADLVKPHHLLNQAYNDSEGVTERFNKNILARINRDLGGNFDLDAFTHRAFFDESANRIEMHLVSLKDQEASISNGPVFEFRAGETIHTENSHKFTVDGFRRMAMEAGWVPARCWTDERQMFSIHLLSQRGSQ